VLPLAAELTGAPAALIIIVILALIVTGVVVAVRATGRGVKKGAEHLKGRDDQHRGA
jgi:hypothetical protein